MHWPQWPCTGDEAAHQAQSRIYEADVIAVNMPVIATIPADSGYDWPVVIYNVTATTT